MKKIILISMLILSCFSIIAQEIIPEGFSSNDNPKKGKGDRLMWGVFTDMWQEAPDSIGIKSMNQGISFHSMLDYPISQKFSFAFGIGLSSHNLYSSSIPSSELDSTSKLTGKTVFYKIPDSIGFQKNKLNVTYVDIPVEFRFRGAGNEGLKIALGFKAGVMLSNHTKYKGDAYLGSNKIEIKEKQLGNQNILNYRYGVTGRIGYKWINAHVFYSMTNLFKKDKGPDMYPVSVGLMFTPF